MNLLARASWTKGRSARRDGRTVGGKFLWLLLGCMGPVAAGLAAPADKSPPAGSGPECVLVEKEGTVEVERKGATAFAAAQVNDRFHVGDLVKTGLRSRAVLRWSETSMVRLDQATTTELQTPAKPGEKPELNLRSGRSYFFNREKPTDLRFRTPVTSGAILGTEFELAVADDGRTVVSLLDGQVQLSNAQGQATTLKSGEQGKVEPGGATTKTALIDAINVIQWVLYYPAVLDPDELGLSDQEKETFKDSLKAYREGDLLAALKNYPEGRTPASDAERLLHAALLLAAGRVEQTEADLKGMQSPSPLANALREVMAAVKHQTLPTMPQPTTGSEWMARSYYVQSQGDLRGALKAAREAASKSPRFGAAWIRVSELEFGFGRRVEAQADVEKGLELSPRNAEGLVLRGFLMAARGHTTEALDYFDQAIAIDGALANAWLGRGLVKIRRGQDRYWLDVVSKDAQPGREDLQVAATLEPQRAVVRSYLGKAFADRHDVHHARKELDLARTLDPNDPTSWLYSALLDQQDNRINEAVGELEKSKELNQNRSLFRSQLLLDQDQAVRGANLAAIYRDEGMKEFGAQEASRAVNNDYGNYSAHLFLANSYDALRDPKQRNLRYETPWFSELLVADLLAPVNGGNLSQTISQQEYSKLFASDGLGIFSSTEYSSHGDWRQDGSQFGVVGDTSYSLDASYRNERGFRPNNDLDQLSFAARFKQQITVQDHLFFEVGYLNYEAGDVTQFYNQNDASRSLRQKEEQTPSLLAGYHHEWAPGVHTLFLFTRIDDTARLTDTNSSAFFQERLTLNNSNYIFAGYQPGFDLKYRNELEAYSMELQQIIQAGDHTVIVGGRFQPAWADTTTSLTNGVEDGVAQPQQVSTELDRFSIYGYENWQPFDWLRLTAGVTYDRLHYPVNVEISPISDAEHTTDRVSPKFGVLWTPLPETHVRGAYSRSLGGVFFDQSVRLEPVQVAGFNDAFRTLLSGSEASLVPGTRFETWGVGLDHRIKQTGTYFLAQGEILKSDGTRTVGMLTNDPATLHFAFDLPSSTRESLEFEEKSLVLAANQLVGRDWVLGARYRLTEGELTDRHPDIPYASNGFPLDQDLKAWLHQVYLTAIYQHPCGLFGEFDVVWSQQSNQGYSPDIPGDDFWQYNVYLGYRFLQRRGEARLGLLNIGDRDYRLNPLTLYNELPRERMLTVSLKLNF